MKATMTCTDTLVYLDEARRIQARVWEGVTEGGIEFTAYIPFVQVLSAADNSQFERELRELKKPNGSTVRAISARLII